MNSLLNYITTILILATLAFFGYYFFLQDNSNSLSSDGGFVTEDLFADVQKYEERRNQLNKIKLDSSIFTDQLFTTLKGYPREIPDLEIGRQNPFDNYVPSKNDKYQ